MRNKKFKIKTTLSQNERKAKMLLIILIFVLLYLIYIITYNIDEKKYIDETYKIYETNLKETDLII